MHSSWHSWVVQFLSRSSRRPSRGKKRGRRPTPRVEVLEDRLAPVVTPHLLNATTVNFTGGPQDHVYLRTTAGILEWSETGAVGSYSRDLNLTAAGIQSLGLAANTVIAANVGRTVFLDSMDRAGGSIGSQTEIVIRSGAVLNAREVAAGANPLTADSTGNSRSLTFVAPTITVANGARILAHATGAFAAGNVTLRADQAVDLTWSAVTPFFRTRTAQSGITIGSATVTGNDITLRSSATTLKYADFDTDDAALARRVASEPLAALTIGPRTGPTITFADSPTTAGTLTRNGGSWITDGFRSGQTIDVRGSARNDGQYTIDTLTDRIMTLIATDVLRAETFDPARQVNPLRIEQVFTGLQENELPVVGRDRSGNVIQGSSTSSGNLVDSLSQDIMLLGSSVPVPVQAVLSDSRSVITIGSGARFQAARDVTINASAISDVTVSALGIIVGGTYGESKAIALANVNAGASIIAGANFNLSAIVTNNLALGTKAYSGIVPRPGLPPRPFKIPGPAVSFAVGKAESNSQAVIHAGATITAGSALVRADNTNDFNVSTGSKVLFPGTNLGSAAGIAYSDTRSRSSARVAGSVTAMTGDVHVDSQSLNENHDTQARSSVKNKLPLAGTKGPGAILAPVGNKINSLQSALDLRSKPGALGIAAGIVIASGSNEAEAQVSNSANVTAKRDVRVTARAEDNYKAIAVGSSGSGAEVSLGGAVTVADYVNQANAFIGNDAVVIAGRDLLVTADAIIPNQVEITDDLAAIASYRHPTATIDNSTPATFFKSFFDYASKGLISSLNLFQRIIPYLNVTLGVPGKIATTYTGASSTAGDKNSGDPGRFAVSGSVNLLTTENRARAWIGERTRAQAGASATVAATATVETINVVGIPNVLSLYEGTAKSEGGSVGGTYSGITYDNSARAFVDDGASVQTEDGGVTVRARTYNFVVDVTESGASGSTFGIQGTFTINKIRNEALAYIEDQAQVDAGGNVRVIADHDALGVIITGSIVQSSQVGVGVSAGVNDVVNTTRAFIGNQDVAPGTTTPGVVAADGEVHVEATSDAKFFAIAIAGTVALPVDTTPPTGQGAPIQLNAAQTPVQQVQAQSGFGISGDVSLNDIDDTTHAFIRDNVIIIAGTDVIVLAHNQGYFLSVAGAAALNFAASAGGVAIAGAATINDLDRDVQAFTHNATLRADRNIIVGAENLDEIVSVTAGASIRPLGTGSVSLIGSANVNLIDTTTKAGLWGATSAEAGASVGSSAIGRVALVSVAGGVNVTSTQVAIGAAADVSVINNTVTSAIRDTAQVTAKNGNVFVVAAAVEDVVSVAAAVQVATRGTGISGSASSQNINPTVEAFVGPSARVNAHGSILIDADDRTNIVAVGGVVNVAPGGTGVGLSLGNINVRRNVKAHADSPTLSAGGNGTAISDPGNQVQGNGILIDANTREELRTIAGAGAYSGQVTVDGSVTVLTHESTTQAYLAGTARPTTDGDVVVAANSTADVLTVAGSITIGGNAGVGASVSVVTRSDTALAFASPSAVIVARGNRGSGTAVRGGEQVRGLTIIATSSENVETYAAGLSGGATAGLAGSVTVNVLTENTRAYLGDGAQVNSSNGGANAGQSVHLIAADTTRTISVAGGVAFGGSAGIGAGVDVTVLNKDTQARIGAGAVVHAANNVRVLASSVEDATSVAASAALSGTAGIAGSAEVSVYTLRTFATIEEQATVTAAGTVQVAADDHTELDLIAGGAAIGLTAGVGASVSVPVINKRTIASIGTGAQVTGLGSRAALRIPTGQLGITFVNNSSDRWEVKAPLLPKDPGTDSQALTRQRVATPGTANFAGVAVTATNRDDIEAIGATGALAGTAAISLAGSVSVHTIDTQAFIGAVARVNENNTGAGSDQSVLVAAANDYYHLGVAGAASGALTAGVGAGADVTVLNTTTRAFTGTGSRVQAVKDVNIVALAGQEILSIAAGVGAAGKAGIAGLVSVVKLDNLTEAFTGLSSRINAGGNVYVAARDNTETDTITAAAALGLLGGGVGGAVAVTLLEKDTLAYLGASSEVTGKGNSNNLLAVARGDFGRSDQPIPVEFVRGVAVQAASREDVFVVAAAGAGGFYGGLAGAVSVTMIDSDTQAFIGNGAAVNRDTTGAASLQSVQVAAVNDVETKTTDGAIGLSLFGGIAGSVDVGFIRNDTTAFLGDGTEVHAAGNVEVHALARRGVTSKAFGVGAAVGVGLAASVSVWTLAGNLSATEQQALRAIQGNSSTGSYADSQTTASPVHDLLAGYAAQQQGKAHIDSARTVLNNAVPSSQVTAAIEATPLPSGTSATLGNNARVHAGGAIEVNAREYAGISATTGAGALAVGAGVGGSVSLVNLRDQITAQVGTGAQLSAGGDVTVRAEAEIPVSSARAYTGAGGLVGLGAAYTKVDSHTPTTATVGDRVVIDRARDVRVLASGSGGGQAGAFGASFGGLAVGVALANVNATGTTRAALGADVRIGTPTTPAAVRSLTVDAFHLGGSDVFSEAAGGGILSGQGSVASASEQRTVEALVGDRASITVAQDTAVTAHTSFPAGRAEADGVLIGGITVGISQAFYSLTPTVRATVGTDAVVSSGRDTTLRAWHNFTDEGLPRSAPTVASATSSAGTLIGGVGASADNVVLASVSTTVGDRASLSSGNNVFVIAQFASGGQQARADTRAYGFATGGSSTARVSFNDFVNARTGIGTRVTAGNDVTILADTSLGASAIATGGRGGVIAGGNTLAEVDFDLSTNHTRARIGNSSQVTAGRLVTVQARNRSDVLAHADGSTGAGFGGDSAEARALAAWRTTAEVGTSAVVRGNEVHVEARDTDNLIQAVANSYYAGGPGAATSTARVTSYLTDHVAVEANASIIAPTRIQLTASQDNHRTRANSQAEGRGIAGADAYASNDTRRITEGRTATGSRLETDCLEVYARSEPVEWFRRAAVIGLGQRHLEGNDGPVFLDSIDFNSIVNQRAGRNPELIIDAAGNVVRAYGIEYRITPTTIFIDRIHNTAAGKAIFTAGGSALLPGLPGLISGTARFGDNNVIDRVTIVNRSTRELVINHLRPRDWNGVPIDVTVNATPITSFPAGQLRDLLAQVHGIQTVYHFFGDTTAGASDHTRIDIQNLSASAIRLNGRLDRGAAIENAGGTTQLLNSLGLIASNRAAGLIETTVLEMRADRAAIGTLANRISARLAQAFGWNARVSAVADTDMALDLRYAWQDLRPSVPVVAQATARRGALDIVIADSIPVNPYELTLFAPLGGITVRGGNSDLRLQQARADVGTVRISTTTGAIVGLGAGPHVQGVSAILQTGNALLPVTRIGSSTGRLLTQVNNLDASTGSGGIWITNTGALNITRLLTANSGAIDLINLGPLTIPGTVTASGLFVAHIALIARTQTNLPGDLLVTDTGRVTAPANSVVTLLADRNVTLRGGSALAAGREVLVRGDVAGGGATLDILGRITAPVATIHADGNNDTVNLARGADTTPTMVWANRNGATINVRSTSAALTVRSPLGATTINVSSTAGLPGNPAGVVDPLQGLVTVVGSGRDTLNVSDTASTANEAGTLTDTRLTGLGMGQGIAYSGLANLNVRLGSGNDLFAINEINPLTTTLVDGGSGSDRGTATFAQDFRGRLTLANFENGAVAIGRDLVGTLTDNTPGSLDVVNVGRSVASTGTLRVGSILTLSVGQDVAGLVDVTGNVGRMTVGRLVNNQAVPGNISGRVDIGNDLGIGMVYGTVSGQIDVGRDVATVLKVFGNQSGEVRVGRDANEVVILGTQSGRFVAGCDVNLLEIGAGLAGSGMVLVGDDLGNLRAGTDSGNAAHGLFGQVVVGGDLFGAQVEGAMSGTVAVQGDLGMGMVEDGQLTRYGGMSVARLFSGRLAVQGNIHGDLWFLGDMNGRIAARGQAIAGLDPQRRGILGNVLVEGNIGAGAAIVSGGVIGDAAGGTVVQAGGVAGILAARGDIAFGALGDGSGARIFENASGSNAAAIDAVFTHLGNALTIDTTTRGLADLARLLGDLAALRVDASGNLTGVTP